MFITRSFYKIPLRVVVFEQLVPISFFFAFLILTHNFVGTIFTNTRASMFDDFVFVFSLP